LRRVDNDTAPTEVPSLGRGLGKVVWANVKPMPNRKRHPPFSPFLYRYRNLVERFFNKLKHFRAVATRYAQYTTIFGKALIEL
jgi:transposase